MVDLASIVERMQIEVDQLKSRTEIHEILCSMARAADRSDAELQASCFHPGGTDYRGVANGPFENCCDTLTKWDVTQSRHTIQNISMRFEGADVALVETYVDAFHFWEGKTKGEGRFEFIQTRYLDRFERREGIWKIARRMTIWDECWLEPEKPSWLDEVSGGFVKERNFMRGTRDRTDPFYTFKLPADFQIYEPDLAQ